MKKSIIIAVVAVCAVVVIGLSLLLVLRGQNWQNNQNEFSLVYSQNAGIPYTWEYEIEDETILKAVDAYVVRDDNQDGRVGARVYKKYVFQGLKEGKTFLTFKFVNFTNNEVENAERYIVTVDKDLKTTYVNIN